MPALRHRLAVFQDERIWQRIRGNLVFVVVGDVARRRPARPVATASFNCCSRIASSVGGGESAAVHAALAKPKNPIARGRRTRRDAEEVLMCDRVGTIAPALDALFRAAN